MARDENEETKDRKQEKASPNSRYLELGLAPSRRRPPTADNLSYFFVSHLETVITGVLSSDPSLMVEVPY